MRDYVEEFLESARREVDALTPGSPPIAGPPPPQPRSQRSRLTEALRLSGFVPDPLSLQWRHPDGRVLDEEELLLRAGR